MSVFLFLTGIVRQQEGVLNREKKFVMAGPIQTNYIISMPWLDGEVLRDPVLQEDKTARPGPKARPSTLPG